VVKAMKNSSESEKEKLSQLQHLLALHRAIAGSDSYETLGIKLSQEMARIFKGFSAYRIPVIEGELGKEYFLGGKEHQFKSDDWEILRGYIRYQCERALATRESFLEKISNETEAGRLPPEVTQKLGYISVHLLENSQKEISQIACILLSAETKITPETKAFLRHIGEILSPAVETIELRKAYEESLERAEALMRVSQIISGKLELRELLTVLARQCSWLLKADRTTVWLYDEEQEEIWTIVGEGLRDEIRMPVGVGIAGNVARTLQTLNISDPYSHPLFNPEVDKKTGYVTRNILCMPLLNKKGELIGVYQVLNKLDHPHFTKEDEELLAALSGSAAVAIENARLYEDQKKQFNSFIEVLATSVDAKDPTTADHSKMVTGISVAIAKELGYPPQKVELIRVAAVLHDYGKIAVPDAILCKPGSLNEEEFKIMRSHVSKTIEILSKVYFSKEMRDVPRISGMHHEKLDGTGYPLGLKDGEISQEGAILAVADILHAMMQERPYKKGLTPREALAECKKLTAPHVGRFGDKEGIHLDPEVVNALERVMERENYDPHYFLKESGWSDISAKEIKKLNEQYQLMLSEKQAGEERGQNKA